MQGIVHTIYLSRPHAGQSAGHRSANNSPTRFARRSQKQQHPIIDSTIYYHTLEVNHTTAASCRLHTMSSPTYTGANSENDQGSFPDTVRARPLKKISIIAISFIPAIALLFITNVIVAHLHVASTVLLSRSHSKNHQPLSIVTDGGAVTAPELPKAKKTVPPPQKKKAPEIKTVHVPPTPEDLARIRQELETTDPLPPITNDDSDRSSNQAQSVTSSLKSLLDQRDEASSAAQKEYLALAESYNSFKSRFEDDILNEIQSQGKMYGSDTKLVEEKLKFLTSLLGRRRFLEMDRENVTGWFDRARLDLRWLLEAEDESDSLFVNNHGILSRALLTETIKDAESTSDEEKCLSSYLTLEEEVWSSEFDMPLKRAVSKPKVKNNKKTVPIIAEDTARESDLYERVVSIKNILSRRDLSSAELDENGNLPSPLGTHGTIEIQSQLASQAKSHNGKRQAHLNQKKKMKQAWEDRFVFLVSNSTSSESNDMCASSGLVENMVLVGLEAFRRKRELRLATIAAVFASIDGESQEEKNDMLSILTQKLETIDAPSIDYGNGGDDPSSPPEMKPRSSSWTAGRKSVFYSLDGPLLHRGVAGSIDAFVDVISGYNDNVDSVLDWIVGDEGVSVGTSIVTAVSKLSRKVPLPDEYVSHIKKSGILAGRTRSLFE